MSGSLRIGFLGAGKMASALAHGWIQAGLTSAATVCPSDPVLAARDHFTQLSGAAAHVDNLRVVADADVLVLAVKPQNMAELLTSIKPSVQARHLVISIAAGVTLHQIATALGADKRIVRVM